MGFRTLERASRRQRRSCLNTGQTDRPRVSTDKKQSEFEGNIYNETIFLDNLYSPLVSDILNINERRGTLK